MSRDEKDWETLVEAPSQPVGEMWCELLRNHDIPAFLRGTDFGGITGFQPKMTGCAVMVPGHLRDQAVVVLRDLAGVDFDEGGI